MIGGGINGYEDPLETAIRETMEESGLDIRNRNPKLIFMSRVDLGNGVIYQEHSYVYMVEMNDVTIDDIKIEEGKNLNPDFKTKEEILELIDQKIFIPVVNYRDKIEKLF